VIDSHTHLDSCAEDDAVLVAGARTAGVRRILTIGQDAASTRRGLAAAAAHPEVFVAAGHHPNHATGFTEQLLDEIAELAAHPDVRAIGETGRDDFRDHAPAGDQRRAFRGQIELARALRKPLVIHTRACEDETIATLREHAAGLDVILHCFSMPDRLDECLAEGWWISLAGNVTYRNNAELAAAAARVPDERLLVETDAPYLTPEPHRKERNRPELVTETARFVAGLRGQSYQQLDEVVERNAARLFGWGEPER